MYPKARFARFEDCGFAARPWLILGKGPSYSKLASLSLDRFNILTMNHVVKLLARCDIAHFADWEAFEACAEDVESRAGYACLPYVPFVQFRPSSETIDQLSERVPILDRLREAGRLLTYNLVCTSSSRHLDGFPDIHLTHFSSEAVIDFLGRSKVTRILSLGVDGGTSYASAFGHLTDTTLLASGQPTYDWQYSGITDAILRTGAPFAPADMQWPIRVIVEHDPTHAVAARVLAFSFQRHAPVRLDFEFEEHRCARPRPHSGIRFGLDAAGSIRVDARSLVLGNLMPLLRRAFDRDRKRTRQLIYRPRRNRGCKAAAPWFKALVRSRIAMFERSADYPWNSPDCESRNAWLGALREAVYWRRISIRQLRTEMARGHLSPAVFESMAPKRRELR